MPDISYAMQLQNAMQNQPMQSLDTLMNSIGNTWQRHEAGTDEQAVVSFFTKNSVTPETIQQFSSEHPQMPLMDVYKYAGAIETQKKAQGMKDKIRTLTKYISEGGELNEKVIPTLFPDATPSEIKELGSFLTSAQQQGINFRAWKAKENPLTPIGARGLYNKDTKETIGAPPETANVDYELNGRMIKVTESQAAALEAKGIGDRGKKIEGTQKNENYITQAGEPVVINMNDPIDRRRVTNEGLTPYEKPVGEKVPQIRSVDRGDVVDIYENGAKVRTEQKGQTPGTVPKEAKGPTTIDLKRIMDMAAKATDGKEPTETEIAIINSAAGKAGYEFKKLTGKTAGYGLPGVDKVLWGGNETSEWRLVPKQATGKNAGASELAGKPSGKYRVNGNIVKWDGSKIIP